jgi:SRSO17 transposase
MIRPAPEDGVPSSVLLADAAHGNSRHFWDGVRELGLHYVVEVDPKTVVAVF